MANQIAEFFARIFLKNEISPELDMIIDELLSLNKIIENSKHPELLVREKEKVQELTKAFVEAGGKVQELSQILTYQGAAGASRFNKEIETLTNNSYNNFRAIGQMDRITREFASGGLNQGLNGLTMFGNSLTRLAAQEGGFKNAVTGLASSFTGPAGIVLAVSSVIGIFEEYQKELKKTEQEQENLRKGVSTDVSKVEVLVARYNQTNISLQERKEIISKLNSESPEYFGNLNKENTSIDDLNKSYTLYIQNIQNVLTARVLEAKLSEMISNRLKYEKENGIELLKSGYRNPEYLNDANKKLAKDKELIEAEKNMAAEIAKISATSYKNTVEKPKKEKEDTTQLEILKKQKEFYKENIYEYKNYADLIVLEEERLAIKKAEKSKASAKEIANIHEVARIGLETNQKVLGENIAKILDKDVKEQQKIQKQNEKDLYDSQVYFANQRIKSIEAQSNVETKLFAGNYLKQKEAIKVAMAEIGAIMVATSNPKALMDLANAFDYLNNKLNAFGGVGKKITDMIDQMMISSFTSLGETIGNAITSGSFDFSAIGDIIANGLVQIGQALIAFATMEGLAITALKDPALWPVALAGGIAAVAAGTVLKNSLHPSTSAKKMAEGGIVSTPTFAMIGEGGQSEAVLPLNKLGNIVNNTFNAGMMNSGSNNNGNGQFILRGNDLVLALQRSNYSLNLRRGA